MNKNNFSRKKISYNNFNKEITIVFFEMLMMIKLFHWKTHSHATHKATDELYESLNKNMDNFIEVLLGKTGSRIDLMGHKTISLIDLNSQEQLESRIKYFKSYLVGLTNNKTISSMSNTDLLNIRDEILGDLNKFLYLLTFK
jgi:DNA-binding ferritin-like protein